MTTETKTNSTARKVKLISFLCIILGLVAWIAGFATDVVPLGGLGALAFFGGFFGFVVGRFME